MQKGEWTAGSLISPINVVVKDFDFQIAGNPVPVVIDMASHHVDMVVDCLAGGDSLDFSRTMAQYGMSKVHALWLNGYSQATISANPALTNGVFFLAEHLPFQATAYPKIYPAMVRYVREMDRYEPKWTYNDVAFAGWVNAAQFVEGLRSVGKRLTQEGLVAAINKETSFTAGGLIPPVNWTKAHVTTPPPYCAAFVEAINGHFHIAFMGAHHSVFSCFRGESDKPVAPPNGLPGG